MKYTVASAAVRDRVDLTPFKYDAVGDPVVQRIRERVDFEVDDDIQYDSHDAYVRIGTADDRYERLQENWPGTHENPLTDAKIRVKFNECARCAVTEETADAIVAIFTNLADYGDVATAIRDEAHPQV